MEILVACTSRTSGMHISTMCFFQNPPFSLIPHPHFSRRLILLDSQRQAHVCTRSTASSLRWTSAPCALLECSFPFCFLPLVLVQLGSLGSILLTCLGALESALNSCPCWAGPSLMSGPEWETMATLTPATEEGRGKRGKTKRKQTQTPPPSRWAQNDSASLKSCLVPRTVLGAGVNPVSLNWISQPLIESCYVKCA